MAATIIFVLASQGTSWPDMVVWFPMMMDHMKANDGLYPYDQHVPWKGMVYRGGGAIDDVWKNRVKVYSKVEKAKDDVDVFAVLLSVPGLSLPKAGFAAQLILGRFGCLDSINATIFGVPLDVMVIDGDNQPSFVSMKRFMRPDGTLNPTGRAKLELYIQFLDSIKLAASNSISQQLWDSWTEIVAGKIWHASTPRGRLDVSVGKHKVHVPTYLTAPAGTEPHPLSKFDNQRRERELLARVPEKERGAMIGQQHRELITGESKELDDAARALSDALLSLD